MSQSRLEFRVHPSIGFARLGTSEEYYLAPDTSAGMPQPGSDAIGGLPIQPGTESDPITSADLRDANGALKRQAARFRILAYDQDGDDVYPNGGGTEVQVGTRVGTRTVTDIVWTVHLANKKAGAYNVVVSQGVNVFAGGKLPGLRNPFLYGDADDPARLQQLVIDPGPRTVRGASAGPVRFDKATRPTFATDEGAIEGVPSYPQTFPSGTNAFPAGGKLDTLGELRTDEHGRLLVLGGYGDTFSMQTEYGTYFQFIFDVNNNGWFDDASDGPVSAVLVFDDGSVASVHGAWVVCADPAYAPQIRNVVSAWDDVYDTWVRKMQLQPEIYDQGFQGSYVADFGMHLLPVFRAAALTRWTTNLPPMAVRAHEAVGGITVEDDPARTILAGLVFIRNPNNEAELNVGVPLMPLSLGDAGKSFLSVTKTQYFFLSQWNAEQFAAGSERRLGLGERLDFASLSNCLGGRYAPGIEMSYITRQPDIYQRDWRTSGCGPFRIKHKPLDYRKAVKNKAFLTLGWVPLQSGNTGLEPGDTSKFMAVPWQLDYNSCAVHQTSINHASGATPSADNTTLFWSWPAQRPVAVYNVADVVAGKLGKQVYSIRGPGTETTNLASVSTFQNGVDALTQWHKIGFVLQGSAIQGDQPYGAEVYLETSSQLDPAPVAIWPFNAKS